MPADHKPDLDAIRAFQNHILTWYGAFRRDLPWRGDHDPYHVLVSEVMLQQTQVDRVIPKYLAFLERFPTLQALAAAPTADVITEVPLYTEAACQQFRSRHRRRSHL